ncbi:MAG: RNA-guided pseudouridylation complex pseudouridine synthase subunit Cbf5 [Candidatus Hadarchaeum sp.]|uniref:RNA-guided pseudouridylation complex pseudouridine synthase subunit Cbf5 n=1 Tax=Candidatus Hadarchaeum sp. TaxID=2883567 RepID=UPI003D0D3543
MGKLPGDIKREVLVKAHDTTDPEYGCDPLKRPIREHIRLGMINLDKPRGPTSHEIVAWIKLLLNLQRAGHGGTLDPGVSGVLPVALEDATKVARTLLLSGKEYVGVMHLHSEVPQNKLEQTLSDFQGEIYQRPPMRAAVKRQLRVRKVYYIELIECEGREVLMRIGCEAGTYMRKLMSDIGEALGCGAHMSELRRTRTGPFSEKDSVRLHDISDAYVFWKEEGREEPLRRVILPVELSVQHLPRIVVRDGAVDAICHGASLAAPGVLSVDSGISVGDLVAVFTLKGELIGLARAAMGSKEIYEADHGIVAKPERIVMSPGTYPKKWK